MNKTQINYFKEKVNQALKEAIRGIEESMPEVSDLTTEEKVGQITAGKARFRLEEFAGGRCPYAADKLFQFFEFAGDDEIEMQQRVRVREIDKLVKKARREADTIATNFVLEKLEDPAQALDDFIRKYSKGV